MTGWFAASLAELKDFLDDVGEQNGLTVMPGDDVVAAIIGILNGAPVLHVAAAHAAQVVNTLDLLEQAP